MERGKAGPVLYDDNDGDLAIDAAAAVAAALAIVTLTFDPVRPSRRTSPRETQTDAPLR